MTFHIAQAPKCEISERALIDADAVSREPMTDRASDRREPARLYQLLAAIRPAEHTFASWARAAKVSPSFFNDVKRGVTPAFDKLSRVVGAAGLTMSDFHALEAEKDGGPMFAVHTARTPFIGENDPRDVRLYGTAQAGAFEIGSNGDIRFAEQMDLNLDDVQDMLRRPPALKDREHIYALTVRGTSMFPKFDDGDPIYIDPSQRAAIGDIVVVQLLSRDYDGEGRVVTVLVKELVRRTAEYVELMQYNPALTFRIPMNNIASIHRWVPWKEMVIF